MSVKETLRLEQFENSYAFRLFLTMILMFVINIGIASADDDDSAWNTLNERGAIELVVEDGVDINGTIGLANELATNNNIEQAQTAETQTEPLTVTIPNGVNVRNIAGSDFGNADYSFLRGDVEVVGWFDSENTPLDAIASGTWLILGDGEHAVFSGLVRETDGSSVTDAEAATTPEFEYDGSEFVPVIQVTPTEAPNEVDDEPVAVPEAPTNTPNNDEVNPDITETPEGSETLSFPELPDSMDVSYSSSARWTPDGGIPVISETITINQESLLPIQLGPIEEGFSPVIDTVGYWGEPEPERSLWQRIPLSGVIISIDEQIDGGREFNYIQLLTETPDGNEVIVEVRLHPFTRFTPVNDELQPIGNDDDLAILWDSNDVADDDVIITPTGELRPGDHVIIDIENVEQQGNTPSGTSWIMNQRFNEIPDGTPTAVFEAVDNGTINADSAQIYVFGANRIVYKQ